MHLVGPYLTTTSYKKPKDKLTKAKREELERGWRERNVRLREMNLPKETFEEYLDWVYGRGKKTKTQKVSKAIITKTPTNVSSVISSPVQTNNNSDQGLEATELVLAISSQNKPWITGPVSSKPSPIYTGTKVKGIGTMHKSNAVPIFSDEEAIDISRMRR